MHVSSLQKYILLECLKKGRRADRKIFQIFYETHTGEVKNKYRESIITKSIERLIDKELMIGFGKRTPHRWFITHVKLTKKGKNQALEILNEKQIKLPLK